MDACDVYFILLYISDVVNQNSGYHLGNILIHLLLCSCYLSYVAWLLFHFQKYHVQRKTVILKDISSFDRNSFVSAKMQAIDKDYYHTKNVSHISLLHNINIFTACHNI